MSHDGELDRALARLEPRLHDGVFVVTSVPHATDLDGLEPVATMRETQALTLLLPEQQARARGFGVRLRCAWITLTLESSLEAVGLTAAFASALAAAGIACNVVAGAHHDHLFVPVARAQDAMACLRALQQRARAGE